MRPIEHIRREVFKASQAAFAEIAGTTQASVSRWESGELEPGLEELALIRAEAFRRGVEWDDGLFFAVPSSEQAGAA